MRPSRLLPLAAFLLAFPAAHAQMPDVISYQGYLTDASGASIEDADATLTFRLWEAESGSAAVWTETHTGVAVADGVFSVGLGSVEALDAVAFDRPLWLSTAVGDASAEELLPRVPLTAVPYSLRARSLALPFAETVEASDAPAIAVVNTGSRDAAMFLISNASNFNSAVLASTNGTGAAVFGRTFGVGRAGLFRIDNNGNASPALEAVTTSLSGSVALLANHAGNDPGADIAVFQSEGATRARINKDGTGRFGTVVAEDNVSGAPAPGGVYRDNVVYAWAQVSGNGTLTAGFGCTVTRLGVGRYRVNYGRSLPNGMAPVVTVLSANDPVFATVTPSGTSGADVAVWAFSSGQFSLDDRAFFIQVVGRP